MKSLTTLARAITPHSPAVAWRSVMPENRLGMIVCGAFLGLVSAVIVAKMHEPAAEPDKAVAAETSPANAETAPTPAPPEAVTETPQPTPHTDPVSLPEPTAPAAPHPADAPSKEDATPKPPSHEAPEPRVALNEIPTPPGGFKRVGATEPAPTPEEHEPALPAPSAPPSPMLEPPPPPPPAPPVPDAPPLPLPGDPEKKEKEGADGNKAKDHSNDDKDIKKQERLKEEKEAAPVPLPQIGGANEPPPLPGPPSPLAPPERKEDNPPKAPEKFTPPAAPTAPPLEPAPLKADPPVTAPEPPAPKQDKGTTVVIPASPAPARVEPPPFVPSPARNPIASTPPSGTPLVDSWDERTYVVKPGDTFAAISLSEYKTEDYAKALQMYNQNHPRASDAMRRDGTMGPGDRVYLPPSPVLEKRHADVIVRSKPKPMATGAVSGDGFGPVQADFRAPADKPANPTYKVQGNGETLFQIAAQQLHDGNRWGEIAALNPKAPTDRNVLGGAILQMPAAGSAGAAPPVPHP